MNPNDLHGYYYDPTGFGEGYVDTNDKGLVLEVGATHFRLEHLGGLSFAAHSQAPYFEKRQFRLQWYLDHEGRPSYFATDQGAVFSLLKKTKGARNAA